MVNIHSIKEVLLSVSVFALTIAPASHFSRAKAAEGDAGARLPLVSDHQPRAVIVTADKPTAAAALGARVLSEHIRQISGANLSILKEASLGQARVEGGVLAAKAGVPDQVSTFIIVGESALAAKLGVTAEGLGPGGIRLKTTGNTLLLLGADNADKRPVIEINPDDASRQTTNDYNASLYAVTKFLEDQLGVRYLWPGESGKVIPKRSTLEISPVDVSYTPIIKQRHIRHSLSESFSERTRVGLSQLGVAEEDYPQVRQRIEAAQRTESASPSWYVWQGLGGSMGLKTGHSYGYAWDKYGKDHPEWFALQPNGSRDQSASPGRARFDISNQELQAAIARDRIEELDRNPGQMSVSIDPNDGGYNTFCLDEACKALDPPGARMITRTWLDRLSEDKKTYTYQMPASLTDRMVYFWNGIAERVTAKYPDAILTVRAYSAYVDPPVMRRLHPNIAVEQVSADYFDPERVEKSLDNWTQWSQQTRYLAWRPNIDAGSRRHGLPVIYVHRMAEDVKARVKAGMISTDIDSMQKNWAPNSLNLYVLAKLLWDPSLDVDEIIADYCRAGFGAGAPFMQRYFARIEEITMQAAATGAANPAENSRGALMRRALADLYDAATLKELNGLLDQAKEAARDENVARRVEFLRLALAYADVQAQAFRMVDKSNENGEKIDKKAVLPFMKKRYQVMRSLFLSEPVAFDIPYLLWGSEGNFRALQSKESWKILADGSDDKALQASHGTNLVDANEFGEVEEQAPKTP